MTQSGQTADLDWTSAEVPVSRRFDDPYFSLAGGLDETRHVFLAGNALPGRFRPGFHIAETGFGTGLNLLVAWIAWRGAGMTGPLRFTSFEAFPMAAADMARALAAFPQVAAAAAPLLDLWAGGQRRLVLDGLDLEVIVGDVGVTLPGWTGRADAWFLDGFSPAKNPRMWEAPLMAEVARHTVPGGTFATYTAAGAVRRALSEAGFTVSRQPGFGRKRHMTAGVLPLAPDSGKE